MPAVICPKCARRGNVPVEVAGRKIQCKCGHRFVAVIQPPSEQSADWADSGVTGEEIATLPTAAPVAALAAYFGLVSLMAAN